MRVPSGDQTGVRYSPCTGVRSFSPVPSPDTTKIPGAPKRRLAKATRPGPAGGPTVAEAVAPERVRRAEAGNVCTIGGSVIRFGPGRARTVLQAALDGVRDSARRRRG